MAYVVQKVEGRSFDGNFKLRPTVGFEVRFEGDDSPHGAYNTNRFWADEPLGRSLNGLRLDAEKQRKAYQSYFERTGSRLEVERREKAKADADAKKVAQHLARLKATLARVDAMRAEVAALEAGDPEAIAAALKRAA